MATQEVSLFEKIRRGEQGMFDPTKRYSFTNVSEEMFEFGWNGTKVEVAPTETIELPQYLAYQAVNKFIDYLITTKAKKELDKIRETNPTYLAPNGAGMLGVPAFRVQFEKMCCRELSPKTGSDAKLDIIRAKEQVMADIKRSQEEIKPLESIPVGHAEFAELNEKPPVIVS